MNKQKLAMQIDHTLKDAKLRKNVIKGIGWKGNGHRYYTGGYNIITSGNKCVIVTWRKPHELIPLSLSMVSDYDLSEYGQRHKQEIRNQTRVAIDQIKSALSAYQFEELRDEYDLPYLSITEIIYESSSES